MRGVRVGKNLHAVRGARFQVLRRRVGVGLADLRAGAFLAAAFLVGVSFVEVATRILTLVGAATRYLCVGLRRLLRLPQFRRATNDYQWLLPRTW